jgi:hypothetical protein
MKLKFYTPVGKKSNAWVRKSMDLGSIAGTVTGFTVSRERPDDL